MGDITKDSLNFKSVIKGIVNNIMPINSTTKMK